MTATLAANARSRRPLVLIHGYSDQGRSWDNWAGKLQRAGYDASQVRVGNYVSLTNEITIKDLARGFDRALRLEADLAQDEEFDAIVHSTGMLVLRSWLVTYPQRKARLKHLIGLAPATFGSPLAHKGRSWIGSLFKGSHHIGPDFMESGDQILDGLELGSRFTWELAHRDLVGPETYYGADRSTPYAFVFVGNKSYDGIRKLVNEPGTDGTVRWAGCSLDSRKITVDLTAEPSADRRYVLGAINNVSEMPVVFVDGVNHGTILSEPPDALVDLVDGALQIETSDALSTWTARAAATSKLAEPTEKYQQFVIRAVDDRGDPIDDYNVEVLGIADGNVTTLETFDVDVHAYSTDQSFRCFHVELADALDRRYTAFRLRITASTGTTRVGYLGYCATLDAEEAAPGIERPRPQLEPVIEIDVPGVLPRDLSVQRGDPSTDPTLFFPYTTTLVEIRIGREPLPVGSQPNEVCQLGILRA